MEVCLFSTPMAHSELEAKVTLLDNNSADYNVPYGNIRIWPTSRSMPGNVRVHQEKSIHNDFYDSMYLASKEGMTLSDRRKFLLNLSVNPYSETQDNAKFKSKNETNSHKDVINTLHLDGNHQEPLKGNASQNPQSASSMKDMKQSKSNKRSSLICPRLFSKQRNNNDHEVDFH